MTKLSKQIEPISLCPNCNCMTKTIKGKCGKCGAVKDNTSEKIIELLDTYRENGEFHDYTKLEKQRYAKRVIETLKSNLESKGKK